MNIIVNLIHLAFFHSYREEWDRSVTHFYANSAVLWSRNVDDPYQVVYLAFVNRMLSSPPGQLFLSL